MRPVRAGARPFLQGMTDVKRRDNVQSAAREADAAVLLAATRAGATLSASPLAGEKPAAAACALVRSSDR